MQMLVRLIGIIITAMGGIILLNPRVMKQIIGFWAQGKRVYIVGILRLLIGIILLWAAPQCRLAIAVKVFGVLTIITGAFIFILGLEKTKAILNWWDKRPLLVLRLISLIVLAFGAFLIYSA